MNGLAVEDNSSMRWKVLLKLKLVSPEQALLITRLDDLFEVKSSFSFICVFYVDPVDLLRGP